MIISFRSASRILQQFLATAAVLAVLLHAPVTAGPWVEHDCHHPISGTADIQTTAESGAERPECGPGLTNGSCCDAACSPSLLPSRIQIGVLFSGGEPEPEAVQTKSGTEPEGLRRPPRPAS